MEIIKVLIIERDKTIIKKLIGLLNKQKDIELVGQVESIEEGINVLNSRSVDVVMANYLLLENNYLDKYYNFINKNISIKKVILSSNELIDIYYNAFRIGSTNIVFNNDIDLIPEILHKGVII